MNLLDNARRRLAEAVAALARVERRDVDGEGLAQRNAVRAWTHIVRELECLSDPSK